MISGAYFEKHAMKQALNRLDLDKWKPDYWQQKIVDQDGEFYWDKKHRNYHAVFNQVIFPFDLELNDSRPGLIAFIRTALPTKPHSRHNKNRFQKLTVNRTDQCVCQSQKYMKVKTQIQKQGENPI